MTYIMMRTITLSLVAAICIGLMAAGCSGGPSPESIATTVAQTWVSDSIDQASDAIANVIVDERPEVARLASTVIASQIRDNLSWTYEAPIMVRDPLYTVRVVAKADINVDAPIIGSFAYDVSVPFDLAIDTNDQSVTNWFIDLTSAKVEKQ